MTNDEHDDSTDHSEQLDPDSVLSEFMTFGPAGEVIFHDVERLHAKIKQIHLDEWAHIITAFDTRPDEFHVAYDYLRCHPIFWRPHVKRAHLGMSADEIAEDELPTADDADGTVEDGDGWFCIDITVVRVDPTTSSISDDPSANTQTEVWMEAGPWSWAIDTDPADRWQSSVAGTHTHDPALDCGATTFEAATIELAKGVRARYGDDRTLIDNPRPYAGWGDNDDDDADDDVDDDDGTAEEVSADAPMSLD